MPGIKYVKKENFPPFLHKIFKIKSEELPITAYARILCQNCGLFNRGILCGPLLKQTYPQYATLDSTIEYVNSFDYAYIYVFQNDGTKRFYYKREQSKYGHIRRRKVESGRQLKGIESVSVRWLTQLMYRIKRLNIKAGYRAETYIPGHCDLCSRKCPNRNNPPCKRGGLPSLEAIGINVYSLLEQLGVEYEYPVNSYLTSVTMMLIGDKNEN